MSPSRKDDSEATPSGAKPQSPDNTAANNANVPQLIPVFDRYGEAHLLTRDKWRDDFLPQHVKAVWNDPKALFKVIAQAAALGFAENVVEAAQRFYEMEQDAVRGASVWGSVLTHVDRLDEAEEVYRQVTAKVGEKAEITIKWALVHMKRGKNEELGKMVHRALELDPNYDEAVNWNDVANRSLGPEAWKAEMVRLAAIEGSWRVKLVLAWAALKDKNLEQALVLYDDIVCDAPKPIPNDVLARMSRDLGEAGFPAQMVDLILPFFDPAIHEIDLGHNIIIGFLAQEKFDAASELLNRLYRMGRADWQNPLDQLDQIIFNARTRKQIAAINQEEKHIGLGVLTEPIWLREGSSVRSLYPDKPKGPTVLFSGNSVKLETQDSNPAKAQQIGNVSGQLIRGMGLLAAEQVYLTTNAMGMAAAASIVKGGWGFAIMEEPLRAGKLVQPQPDYEVTLHFAGKSEPETLNAAVYRVKDDELLGKISVPFRIPEAESAAREVIRQIQASLAKEEVVKQQEPPPLYTINEGAWVQYAVHLEEIMAISANLLQGREKALFHERRIIRGQMRFSLFNSKSVNARLILLQTLQQFRKIRPDILAEFKDRITLLNRENPLDEAAQATVQKAFETVFKS